MVLTNYYIYNNEYYPADLQEANFTNCIIDGTVTNELSLINTEGDDGAEVSAAFNYSFDHCLIKTDESETYSNDTRFTNIIWNEDPLFIAPTYEWNFYPDTLSPVIDMGVGTHLTSDINEAPYIGSPDLGAFEFAGASE